MGCRAEILRAGDRSAAQIMILLNRPFKIRAGMSLNLWMPGLGLRSSLGSHSYPIAWWENDLEGRAKVIWLLVGPNSRFNRRLINNKSRQLTSVIEGPYGLPVDFIEYDRILMIATGIGIAAQMSYLKELVGMKDEKKPRRTLYVVWEVDNDCEYNAYCSEVISLKVIANVDWVNQWMDQLLLMDKETCVS